MTWILLVFACGISGFGNCIDSGVTVAQVSGFTSQASCIKEANEVENRLNARRAPFYFRSHCVEVR